MTQVLETTDDDDETSDPRRWKKSGWIAKVVRNEDGDGWAVEMTGVGDSEPTLVGPWTMGRDKVNPKPMDHFAFSALLKTANEFVRRHAQDTHARLHREVAVVADAGERLLVTLDIAQDEDDPHAMLVVVDDDGAALRSQRVAPNFQLNAKSAAKFVRTGEA